MAEKIQEIEDPNTSIIADEHINKPVRPVNKPTIIRPNSVAHKLEPEEQVEAHSNDAVTPHKKPPPRPSGPPSRPASIYKSDTPTSSETAPVKRQSVHLGSQDNKVVHRRKPEITIVAARPLSEVIGFGKGAADSGALGHPAPSKRLSLNMDSKPGTPTGGPPPPLPSTRPKGKYIPPPLPTSRPKAAYVHPVSVTSTPSSGSSTPIQRISPVPVPKAAPVPKPRSNSIDQASNNHVDATGAAPSSRPIVPPHPSLKLNHHEAEKPPVGHKPPVTAKPHTGPTIIPRPGGGSHAGPTVIPRPVASQRTSAAPNAGFHPPVATKPPVAVKTSSPPKQTSMNDLFSMFGSSSSSSNQSQPKNTSSDFGWQIASSIANNITAKDVQRGAAAVSAAANSEAGRSFGNAAVKTASSSSDPKLQLAGRAAQNVSANDVSRAATTVHTVAGSEQGQKAASNAWNFAQKSHAAGGQNNAAFSNSTKSNSSSAASTPSSSNFDLLTGLFSSQPAQPVAPAPAASQPGGQSLDDLLGFDPVPMNKPKPAAPAAAKPGSKLRPTIIRPGAKGSKPNSRSASPKVELEGDSGSRKRPPPRPSAAPQKGKAPPRPGPPPSGKKQAPSLPSGALKPKRLAPVRPAPGKPKKKSSKDSKGKESKENLPPRPGPGHALFNYSASETSTTLTSDFTDFPSSKLDDVTLEQGGSKPLTGPRAVATFSYDAPSLDDLPFNEGDNIKLLEKISDEWYKGECKGRTGMFPVTFVNIIEDVKPSMGNASPVTSGPRCIAKYDYDSPEAGDLNFPSGAVIKLLERVGDDWLKGDYQGKSGIFPISFVDIVEDVVGGFSMPSTNMPSSAAVNGTSSGNVVRVAYDFDAADSTEISLKEGDMVTVLNQVNSEWLYGEIRGQKGKFPAGFVDYIPPNLSVLSPTDSSSSFGREETGVAQFDFDAANEDELSVRAGDTLTIIEFVGDEWVRGRLNGKEGLLPRAFVDVGGSSSSGFSSGVTTPMSSGTALFDFDGEGSDELTFKTGDLITQIDKVTDEWYEGMHNSRKGRFPAAFVEITS